MKRYIFYTILMFCMAYMLNGCYTQKTATKQLNRAVTSYPILGANFCAWTYPIKQMPTKSDTLYKQADNINYKPQIDSLGDEITSWQQLYYDALDEQKNDTSCVATIKQLQVQYQNLLKQYNGLKNSYVECKPDTIFITDSIPYENTAHVKALQIDSTQAHNDLIAANKTIDKKNHTLLILWIALIIENVLIGVGVYFKFIK